jgi:ribosome modulation factor
MSNDNNQLDTELQNSPYGEIPQSAILDDVRSSGYEAGYDGADPACNPYVGDDLEAVWLQGWGEGVEDSILQT